MSIPYLMHSPQLCTRQYQLFCWVFRIVTALNFHETPKGHSRTSWCINNCIKQFVFYKTHIDLQGSCDFNKSMDIQNTFSNTSLHSKQKIANTGSNVIRHATAIFSYPGVYFSFNLTCPLVSFILLIRLHPFNCIFSSAVSLTKIFNKIQGGLV